MKKIFVGILLLSAITSCETFSKLEAVSSFPIYGNYCGPDYPKTKSTAIPIDMTDLACKDHDLCYEQNGYLNATCDQELVDDLKRSQPQTLIEKNTRKLIISYFKRSPKIN